MSKPKLPSIPESVKSKIYVSSNVCPKKAWILMIGLGIPLVVLIRVIGHFLGIIIPFIGLLFPGTSEIIFKGSYYEPLLMPRSLVLILYIVFTAALCLFFPILLGAGSGYIIGWLSRIGKCRHRTIPKIMGVINAAIGYIIFTIFGFYISGTVFLTFRLDFMFDGVTIPFVWPNNLTWWLIVLTFLDGLLFTVGGGLVYTYFQIPPFCEHCEQWYGNWKMAPFPFSSAEKLVQSLETGTILVDRFIQYSDDYPHIRLFIRRCPSCHTSDYQLVTDVVWKEEETNSQGGKVLIEKKGGWFTTMVPGELGTKLSEKLLLS
jgi:hypothetical protein